MSVFSNEQYQALFGEPRLSNRRARTGRAVSPEPREPQLGIRVKLI